MLILVYAFQLKDQWFDSGYSENFIKEISTQLLLVLSGFRLTLSSAVKPVFMGFAALLYFCQRLSDGVFFLEIGVKIGVRNSKALWLSTRNYRV